MRVAILAFCGISILWAGDEQRLALALKAQGDFDRVQMSPSPQLRELAACIQSQAAVLPVATIDERPLILFRKGYCALTAGAASDDASEFSNATVDFYQALDAWQALVTTSKQKMLPQPVPSALRIFAAVSRLEQDRTAASFNAKDESALTSAVDNPACPSVLMSAESCPFAIRLGNAWLGWIALRHADTIAAQRRFTAAQAPGWQPWVEGQMAVSSGDYQKAASEFNRAVETWREAQQNPTASLIERLGPRPDMPVVMMRLGEAQLLAHQPAPAVQTLDAAIKADSSKPLAFYLRARAKEAESLKSAAMADYALASRTAFAASPGESSGEAHLYQGILLFERKDWDRAEGEFSSALNYNVPAPMMADAVAWRHLAAVAGGSCGPSRTHLERSLGEVSRDFPINDARAALAACGTVGSANRENAAK